MKKKILLTLSHILAAALATVVTLSLTLPNKQTSKLDQLESLILERFIGETDRVAMEDAAADAMVSSLGDRWSYYIPADEYEAYQEQMANAFVGVGITIQLAEESEGMLVVDVTQGGPAEEAGILVGDILVAVLATVVTLAVAVPEAEISKLDQLENLILERFIGESDRVAMEDAAAEAMVDSLGDRWSYYLTAQEYADHKEIGRAHV